MTGKVRIFEKNKDNAVGKAKEVTRTCAGDGRGHVINLHRDDDESHEILVHSCVYFFPVYDLVSFL